MAAAGSSGRAGLTMELLGNSLLYLIDPFVLAFAGIYAVMALGLNVQWGYAGQFNIGVAGFFAAGAYTSAILTTAPTDNHLGGFGLPIVLGLAAAMVVSGLLALLIGLITIRLREDYLAIATISLAEIIRLTLKNEDWLSNGTRGVFAIPHPFHGMPADERNLAFFALVALVLAVLYVLLEQARRAPWGRVLRALREREAAALAAGKNVDRFRLEAFVLGSSVMGLGGSLYAHFAGFISPEVFEPMFGTFIIWVMLIVGGAGNGLGAILGALVIWWLYTFTSGLISFAPVQYATQLGALRVMLVGIVLIAILLWRPDGLLPEARDVGSGAGEPRVRKRPKT